MNDAVSWGLWWTGAAIWSLWFPLYIIPDFIVYSLLRRGGLARLMQAECWNFMAAIYVSGIDGWSDGQA